MPEGVAWWACGKKGKSRVGRGWEGGRVYLLPKVPLGGNARGELVVINDAVDAAAGFVVVGCSSS